MRIRLVFALVLAALHPALARADAPQGWFKAGSDPAAYVTDRDTHSKHGDLPSARLASIHSSKGFGTLMQCFDPVDYFGKRLRFSAYVKAKDVKDWAGLWMRVDGKGSPPATLAFDNMQGRPIKGTKDWTRYEVVLDCGDEAANLCFGILLGGEGTVWMSDVKLEVVDDTVPTTGMGPTKAHQPVNLNFEH